MDIDEITYKDRGEFLRGFSVIIRKNRSGIMDEKTMFLIIGKYFGFGEEFCEKSLEHLMINKYISEKPAVFSNELVAEFFIKNVTKIMSQTQSMSNETIEWLHQTAKINNVDFVI
ncbi:MAG: hypothetical protein KJ666_16040 [Bacteroidetes bacterium]|nr:hypothetical protein [Bacteroidota bacterium]MBU2584181.1 hypothetical protein [Bacteroidota bacterium]